jgi:predicted RNA-binding Zn ribbon-like protein
VRFEFTAGRPVLDFIATLAARGSLDKEKLESPTDLADWIRESGIVDRVSAVGPADLDRVRKVREALAGLVGALIDTRPSADADRALVNAAAAAAPPRLHLEADGLHRDADLDAVLSVLARDGLDLHDSPERRSLRCCEDPNCSRVFIDRSRAQRRRWCGMKGCGDRSKAAAYRRRRRATHGDDHRERDPLQSEGRVDSPQL